MVDFDLKFYVTTPIYYGCECNEQLQARQIFNLTVLDATEKPHTLLRQGYGRAVWVGAYMKVVS